VASDDEIPPVARPAESSTPDALRDPVASATDQDRALALAVFEHIKAARAKAARELAALLPPERLKGCDA
jgi:hypothetical protein